MRKILFTVLTFCLLLSQNVFAQEEKPKDMGTMEMLEDENEKKMGEQVKEHHEEDEAEARFYGGLTFGSGASLIINQNTYGYSELDYDFTTGTTFGLAAGYQLANKHQVQLELLFSNVAVNYADVISGQDNTRELELSYMQIPLTYKLVLGGAESKTNFYLSAGVQVGLLNDVTQKWTIDGVDTPFLIFINNRGDNANAEEILAAYQPDEDDTQFFSSTDFSVIGSMGVLINFTHHIQLNIEFRGGLGLTDLNEDVWQMNNNKGTYEESKSSFGMGKLGLNYLF